jgi:Rap1a immunity proteins
VQSWCREIVNAKPGANDTFSFRPTHQTGFCWGSFGAIQELSLAAREDGTRLLGICLPADSDRVQLIKIFSKYVDDHPELAQQGFARVAGQALIDAFHCIAPPDVGVKPH